MLDDDTEKLSKRPDPTVITHTDEDLPNSYAKLNQLSGRKSVYPEDIEEEEEKYPFQYLKYPQDRKTNNSLFQQRPTASKKSVLSTNRVTKPPRQKKRRSIVKTVGEVLQQYNGLLKVIC